MKKKFKVDKSPNVSPGPNSKQFPIYWPGNEWQTPDVDVRITLQPVPEEESNMEAEQGETIFVPDVQGLPAHFKVGGNRHSSGGTPLDVPDNSFVFSDTRDMKIGGPILASFGKSEDTKKKYTPADLAKKYDINKFRKTLADPDANQLYTVPTAEMMIANFNKKLGQLALVQESKKGYPSGIPEIAMSYLITAAVEPEQVLPLKTSQSGPISAPMQSEGYSKYGGNWFDGNGYQQGGWFNNTTGSNFDRWMEIDRRRKLGLPPLATLSGAEGSWGDPPPVEQSVGTPDGIPATSGYRAPSSTGVASPTAGGRATLPKGDISAWPGDRNDKSNKSEYSSRQWREFRDAFCPECKTNAQLQEKILTNPAFQEDIKKLHDKYGMPKNSPNSMVDSKLGHRWDFVFNKKPGPRMARATIGQDAKPVPVNKLNMTTEEVNAPWWLQDVVGTMGAAGDFLRLKKYLPWAPKISPTVPEATFFDPTRALANNTEQMAIGTQGAGVFSGPQAYSARFSGIQGEGAKNAANILGDYDNRNVQVANTNAAMHADAYNKANEFNAKTALDLYDKTTIANQQFDNSKNQARQELRSQYVNAITNRASAQVLNELYPNYQIDPSTGGMMYFNKGDQMLPGSRSETFDERFQRARAMGISDEAAVKYALGPEQEQYLDARGDYFQNYRRSRRSSPQQPESYPTQ